ncbi:tyrosine phosphatase-like protein [Thamnocephalis sphaerospora]|uniref:Very-long-chain (3R)-3-hydroxyacyl-CoA dehydratase n=1 Tax=Thamnocephalis sphaerospora TaxID=78915 RepID=A0A4P9XLP3_9FUNG|nr:tyrosine phosphatase-like protein [Thamnocephalis sphaerospora]|eukprot:RKP06798.1 tyrosine phosphatase-like protein [Thamnocephalis sphaerospora]
MVRTRQQQKQQQQQQQREEVVQTAQQQQQQPVQANPLASPPLNLRKNPFGSWFGPETTPIYLFVYNSLSCIGWLFIGGLFSGYVQTVGLVEALHSVHTVLGGWVHLLTMTACLEILHAALGIVRASVATTAVQCIMRLLVVTVVTNGLAEKSIQHHWSFAIMVFAWTISETLRYGYYLLNATPAGPPISVIWCRYSFFIVLYPIGAFGEAMQIYTGLDALRAHYGTLAYLTAIGLLLVYPLGLFKMYTHMLQQRKKYLTAAYQMEARVQQAVAEHRRAAAQANR